MATHKAAPIPITAQDEEVIINGIVYSVDVSTLEVRQAIEYLRSRSQTTSLRAPL